MRTDAVPALWVHSRIIEVTATAWIKVVTLAGQSNYYSTNDTQSAGNDPCLAARQPDPPQPGRTDAIVNGCPVCNMTQPCVYDVLNDPAETTNIVAAHPDAVVRRSPRPGPRSPHAPRNPNPQPPPM